MIFLEKIAGWIRDLRLVKKQSTGTLQVQLSAVSVQLIIEDERKRHILIRMTRPEMLKLIKELTADTSYFPNAPLCLRHQEAEKTRPRRFGECLHCLIDSLRES